MCVLICVRDDLATISGVPKATILTVPKTTISCAPEGNHPERVFEFDSHISESVHGFTGTDL